MMRTLVAARFRAYPFPHQWLLCQILVLFGMVLTLEITASEPRTAKYPFKLKPFEIAQVFAKVSGPQKGSPEEFALFQDAIDGKLDTVSLPEALFLASGTTDNDTRKALVAQLNSIVRNAKQATKSETEAKARGKALLEWLHANPMSGGYVKAQTSLTELVRTKKFNCVSSTAIYMVVGTEIGFEIRAVEIPEHAFGLFCIGSDKLDVETTNAKGFDPSRDKKALKNPGGVVYMPEKHRDKRREIGQLGVAGMIYYHRGVELAKQKKYQQAAHTSIAALCLDPLNPSAPKNIAANINNWALALAKEPDSKIAFEQAIKVLNCGLQISPNDRTMKRNLDVTWRDYAIWYVGQNKPLEAIAVARKAEAALQKKSFQTFQIELVRRLAQKDIDAKRWNQALAIAKKAPNWVDKELLRDIENWHAGIYIRWSNDQRNKREFADCLATLEKGAKAIPKDTRLEKNVAYTIQEWLKKEPKKLDDIFKLAKARYAKDRRVHSVLVSFAHRAIKIRVKAKDFQEALERAKRFERVLNDRKDSNRLYFQVYDSWALGFSKQKQWKQAIDIYRKAIEEHGDELHYRRSGAIIVGKWAHELQAAKKWAEAKDVYQAGIDYFPGERFLVSNLKYVEQKLSSP